MFISEINLKHKSTSGFLKIITNNVLTLIEKPEGGWQGTIKINSKGEIQELIEELTDNYLKDAPIKSKPPKKLDEKYI